MKSVSFIVPVRNEEEYIRECLQSLTQQDYPPNKFEIIAVDGRSSDRTRAIIEEMIRSNPQLQCLDNPAGIVPTAMNIGIRAARGEVIIRADGHNIYPRNYASKSVEYLEQTGADNVGGPWVTVSADDSFGAKLVAAILSSPFGVGNSRFRTSREEGFVDTVPFGAFRREVFDRVGMYNEKLVRNQDNDFNARIRKAGGKIYQTPVLTTHYHPVKTFWGLLKYAFNTSQWHAFTLRENKASMGLRHIAPAGCLILLLVLLPASFVSVYARTSLLAMLGLYLLTGFYFSARSYSKKTNIALGVALPFGASCFHLAYAAGVLSGIRYLFGRPPIKPMRPGLRVDVN